MCGFDNSIFPHTAEHIVGLVGRRRWRNQRTSQDQAKGHPAIGANECPAVCRLSLGDWGDVGTTSIRWRKGHLEVLD